MASVEKTVVYINQEWCKGCGICIAFCRKGALSLDQRGKAVLAAEKCSNCAVCEMFCPDFAIELKEEGARQCRK